MVKYLTPTSSKRWFDVKTWFKGNLNLMSADQTVVTLVFCFMNKILEN